MSGPRPEPAVGGVCVVGGALLMVQRGSEPEAGRWSIPGGRVGPGESLSAAVVREVMEETGVAVEVGDLVGWVERIGPDHHFVILDFGVVPVPGGATEPVPGGDVTDAAWVSVGKVRELPLVTGLADFLADHGVL